MIYLNNTTDPQLCIIPMQMINLWEMEEAGGISGDFLFSAKINNTPVEISWEFLPQGVEGGSDFGNYMAMYFSLPEDLPNGSYEMILTIEEPEELRGAQTLVVQIGDYVPDSPDQHEQTIEYEQYT